MQGESVDCGWADLTVRRNPCGITALRVDADALAFEGRCFGSVGPYRMLRGVVTGELDPREPRNGVITDLALAPRNASGLVEYSSDFCVLRPAEPLRGNRRLFVEVNNRGNKLFGAFNRSPSLKNNATSFSDAGGGFLMNAGYSLAWVGWDPTIAVDDDALTMRVPIARRPDGARVTGLSYEYLVFDQEGVGEARLTHAALEEGGDRAVLTVRSHLAAQPERVPKSGWEFTGPRSVRLCPPGTAFRRGAIYELTYPVVDPGICGIGFAATRDFISLLRHGGMGTKLGSNLVGHEVTRALAFAISQGARYVNDHVWLGFNEDLQGRSVFDGILSWMGASAGVGLNYRFAQPGRSERVRQNHLYPESTFPFGWQALTDPVTGQTDSRAARALRNGTMPKMMIVNSSNEYWSKAASLAHTDLQGNDLPDPEDVRFYLLSSTEHTVAGSPPDSPGICQQARNTIDPNPALRALFVALEDWLDGTAPPDSAVPRAVESTAAYIEPTAESLHGVGMVPAESLGWPAIPGVNYSGAATIRNRLDFGAETEPGVLSNWPPSAAPAPHRSFVPKVDADGNDIAGIRLPPVAVPLATYTGWAVRANGCGGPDGCEQFGQRIPFAATAATRLATKDPRLSLEERYGSRSAYIDAVASAAAHLRAQRLLLDEDVDAYVAEAKSMAWPV